MRCNLTIPTLALALVISACSVEQAGEPSTVSPGDTALGASEATNAGAEGEEAGSAPRSEATETEQTSLAWAIVLQGASVDLDPDQREREAAALRAVLEASSERLRGGAAALEVAREAVAALEDDVAFNAGRGAAFTSRGTHEHDAAIMDGRSLASGASAATRNVRNPIELAVAIMEKSSFPLVVGDAGDRLASELGVSKAPQDDFTTNRSMQTWRRLRGAKRRGEAIESLSFGVGALVLDRYGNLSAAASTGGLTDRLSGVVSSAAIIGSGLYADNRAAAVLACGRDRDVLGTATAKAVAARVQHDAASLARAVTSTLDQQSGGCIAALDRFGEVAVFDETGHVRSAVADASGRFDVGSEPE